MRSHVVAGSMQLGPSITFHLEGTKRPELLSACPATISLGSPGRSFMVGDQLDRDIDPAKAAGLETVYFRVAFDQAGGQ